MVGAMSKRSTDYEDETPTRVETPLPTRYDHETRQYLIIDDGEPAERPGVQRA